MPHRPPGCGRRRGRRGAGLLGPALGWWRGPAYEGLGDFGPLAAEAVRLDELRLGALETLADAHLALGRPEARVSCWRTSRSSIPWRESVTERLMLALYRSGRPADALRAYSRLREALDAELGLTPGPAVRELEESIVVQRPELDLARGTEPRADRDSMPGGAPDRRPAGRDAPRSNERGVNARTVARVSSSCRGRPASERRRWSSGRRQPMGADGACVLIGRCDPEPSSDYEPLPQLVRAALEARRVRGAGTLPILGELARLVPDEADRLPTERHRSPKRRPGGSGCSPRCRRCSRCSRRPRLVLVAEDLHWAGRDAFALLRHLLSTCDRPLLVDRRRTATTSCPRTEPPPRGWARAGSPVPIWRSSSTDSTAPSSAALVRAWGPEELRTRMLSSIDELRRPHRRESHVRARGPARGRPSPRTSRRWTRSRPAGCGRWSNGGSLGFRPRRASTLSVAAVLGREFPVCAARDDRRTSASTRRWP